MTNDVEQIIENLIEVTLKKKDDFLKVMETLTRMGVSNDKNELFQSCHILQKRGKIYILHFKTLFLLDGKSANITEEDVARTNTIANLLHNWGLVELVDPEKSRSPVLPTEMVTVIKFTEKKDWNLVPKYRIGSKKKIAPAAL